jgi:hypothetical protein
MKTQNNVFFLLQKAENVDINKDQPIRRIFNKT